MNNNTSKMIKISLLSALALVLMYMDFPVIPLFPWLKIDLSDVPALLGAFGFGPLAGIIIELVKNILIVLVKGSSTGLVGEVANFLIGISLILPAAFMYNINKTKKSAVIGMFFGAVCMEAIGIIANIYFLLPVYGMQMTGEQIRQYIFLGLLPFNGIKSIIVLLVTYVLYSKLSGAIFKEHFGTIGKNKIINH